MCTVDDHMNFYVEIASMVAHLANTERYDKAV
jgi:hypothetical protein